MVELVIQIIIVMIICGFVYWVYLQLIPLAPIADPFRRVLDVMVLILVGCIILFYAIIPMLKLLPRMLH